VPSAITYQVQKLEEDLDVLLFDRRGHRARLTPAGREVVAAGRVLLQSADELARRVRRVATGWERSCALPWTPSSPGRSSGPLTAEFYAYCHTQGVPVTRLRFAREVLAGAWDALGEGRADLVIGATGDPPGPGYRTRPLAEAEMVFAVAPSHPLAKAREPHSDGAITAHRGSSPPTARDACRCVRSVCSKARKR
jgi:DNA-binding transcriptional LysR family regulator